MSGNQTENLPHKPFQQGVMKKDLSLNDEKAPVRNSKSLAREAG
jgi:hypothetical protein